jgi:hypothetical protein
LQIKFYLSAIFTRYFTERIIHTAFEKIDEDMDIVNLLKKQIMMKRISKETRFAESEIDLYIPEFEKDKAQDKELLEKDQET